MPPVAPPPSPRTAAAPATTGTAEDRPRTLPRADRWERARALASLPGRGAAGDWAAHGRLGAGIFCSALVLALVGTAAGTPLLIAPLVATAALKHTGPHDPGVAPRRVVLGHLVGATVGVGAGALLGEGSLALAGAAAGAAVLMRLLDVAHAPAVATAFVAVQHHGDHWFPLQVALAGAAVLVATTVVLSPLLHGHRYPVARPVAAPETA